jgi:phosphoribosylformylglycinamidine cyclo-ligase
VKPVLNLVRDFEVKGLVHVTGGGFPGNVPRVLPKGVRARIDLGSWPRLPVFDWLQRRAELPDTEMFRVFNCGIGMIAIVPAQQAPDVLERLQGLGERAYLIGAVERRKPDEPDEPALRFVRARRAG